MSKAIPTRQAAEGLHPEDVSIAPVDLKAAPNRGIPEVPSPMTHFSRQEIERLEWQVDIALQG